MRVPRQNSPAMHATTNTPATTMAAARQFSPTPVSRRIGAIETRATTSGATKRRRSWAADALRQAISGPTPVRTSSAMPIGVATCS